MQEKTREESHGKCAQAQRVWKQWWGMQLLNPFLLPTDNNNDRIYGQLFCYTTLTRITAFFVGFGGVSLSRI